MSKIDIDIYVSQIIKFFESNPNELMLLIGDIDKELFYEHLKVDILKNDDEKGDPTLTRQQMIDIVVKLHGGTKKDVEITKIDNLFMFTNYGEICLN
jgi:hypothetical protein